MANYGLQSILIYILIGIIGACIGSFLNVVIYRLPKMLQHAWREQCQIFLNQRAEVTAAAINLFKPRSFCPGCKKTIPLYRNIPLISFLLQRGHCAYCKIKIARRYLLVELLTALLAIFIVYHFGISWQALFAFIFSCTLIALMFIDIDQQLLPDNLTLSLMWLGLLVNSFGLFTTLKSAIWGAALGYLMLWLVGKFYHLIRKREGMGYGDFKLLAALGAWNGVQLLLPTILLSSLIGLLAAIYLVFSKRLQRQQPFAFGPYLIIAGWIMMIGGTTLLNGYLNLLR